MQDKVLVAPRNINGAGEAGDQKETNLKKRSPYSGRVAIPVAKRQYTEGWDYPPGLDKPKRYSSEPRYYEKKRGKKVDQNFKTYDIYRFDVFKYHKVEGEGGYDTASKEDRKANFEASFELAFEVQLWFGKTKNSPTVRLNPHILYKGPRTVAMYAKPIAGKSQKDYTKWRPDEDARRKKLNDKRMKKKSKLPQLEMTKAKRPKFGIYLADLNPGKPRGKDPENKLTYIEPEPIKNINIAVHLKGPGGSEGCATVPWRGSSPLDHDVGKYSKVYEFENDLMKWMNLEPRGEAAQIQLPGYEEHYPSYGIPLPTITLLSADPNKVIPGQRIKVRIDGLPGGQAKDKTKNYGYDWHALVPKDLDDDRGKRKREWNTGRQNQIVWETKAPDKAGDYQIRVGLGGTRGVVNKVRARLNLTVIER
jgi:hypothetical protein